MTRRLATAFTIALLAFVSASGCASDDEGNEPTEAATDAADSSETDARTLGEGIESLQDAQARLCPELSDLEADLREVAASGTEPGQDALAGLGSFAAAFEAAATALTGAGAADAAAAAEDLASSLEALSTSGGEDARARADEAADAAQQLTDALQCP